jgi:hypothetical protein
MPQRKTVTVFVCSDGEEFRTKSDANKHEAELRLRKFIETEAYAHADSLVLEAWMIDNARALSRLLADIAHGNKLSVPPKLLPEGVYQATIIRAVSALNSQCRFLVKVEDQEMFLSLTDTTIAELVAAGKSPFHTDPKVRLSHRFYHDEIFPVLSLEPS